ncbi:MAG: hypothetical protein VW709_00300, partial [Rickettsiales bacterium]
CHAANLAAIFIGDKRHFAETCQTRIFRKDPRGGVSPLATRASRIACISESDAAVAGGFSLSTRDSDGLDCADGLGVTEGCGREGA